MKHVESASDTALGAGRYRYPGCMSDLNRGHHLAQCRSRTSGRLRSLPIGLLNLLPWVLRPLPRPPGHHVPVTKLFGGTVPFVPKYRSTVPCVRRWPPCWSQKCLTPFRKSRGKTQPKAAHVSSSTRSRGRGPMLLLRAVFTTLQ